jgi:histidinol-phosphatase
MNQQSDHELQKFKHTAEDIVRDTRSIIKTGVAQGFSYHLKPDGTFVTDIDLAVEDLIRSRLRAAFPDHGILGEERPETFAESDYRWIIDPVDGTRSFRHRIPLFGTLLALRHRDHSIVGVIDLPALDRTYIAASGLGARCNGQQIQLKDVASEDAIDFEVIAVGEREQFVKRGKAAAFDSLMRSHASVRTYCDCFGHALAIEGCVGAMVDYNLRIWDVAATEVLIQEVGGKYVRVNVNARRDTADARYDVVFGKPTVVEWVLKALRAEADS